MRIIASFYKHEQVMFVSHLDMQRLFQRAFRRADLPLAYSNGFNPHPLLSFATALSVGYTSDCEYFDVMLSEYVSPAEFKRRVNAVLPQGVHIVDAVDAGEFKASLTPLMRSAEYDIELEFVDPVPREAFYAAVDKILNGGEIIVSKKTKGGIKDVDIRPLLLGLSVSEFGGTLCKCDRSFGYLTKNHSHSHTFKLSLICTKRITPIKKIHILSIQYDCIYNNFIFIIPFSHR